MGKCAGDSIGQIVERWRVFNPPPDLLDWLVRGFAEHYPDDLPCPELIPLGGGRTVILLWKGKNAVVNLFSRGVATDTSETDLSSPEGWARLVEFIRK